jgi:hypothetical protein
MMFSPRVWKALQHGSPSRADRFWWYSELTDAICCAHADALAASPAFHWKAGSPTEARSLLTAEKS